MFSQRVPNSYITDFRIHTDYVDMYGFMGEHEKIKTLSMATVKLEIPATDAIIDTIIQASKFGSPLDIFRQEWRCLYCGCAVEINHTHCPSCGGPRTWIL